MASQEWETRQLERATWKEQHPNEPMPFNLLTEEQQLNAIHNQRQRERTPQRFKEQEEYDGSYINVNGQSKREYDNDGYSIDY